MKGGIYMIIFLRNFINKRMVSWILVVIIYILCVYNATEIFAKDNLRLYASSYALTDASTGRVLVGKNENLEMANASTTKILTCIVALENCDLDENVVISEQAASQPKVRLGMGVGEIYPLRDMLYGLMLESYNDCAVAIAEHVAGSTEKFAIMMNQKAAEIGCENTFFLTPNGLDMEQENQFHHTTANDLCKIMAYCVWGSSEKDSFLEITQTKDYSGSANNHTYTFVNRNALLGQIDGLLTGKTGYTAKAGYCYVAAYEKDGERYCVALLACGWPNNKNWKWQDTHTLLNYAINNYDMKRVIVEEIQEEIVVDGYIYPPQFWMLNRQDIIKITAEEHEYAVLLGNNENVRKEVLLYSNMILPIKKEQIMGQCNIYIEDTLLDTIMLVAKDESNTWELKDILKVSLSQFFTFSS